MTAGFITTKFLTSSGSPGNVLHQSQSNTLVSSAGGVWNLREIPNRPWPSPGSAPVAANAPTNFTATAGNAQVALSWTAPSAMGSHALSQYRIKYAAGSSLGSSPTTVNTGSTSTTHTITGLTNAQQYAFQVQAITNSGSGLVGAVSAVITSTPANTGITPNSDNKVRCYLHSTASSFEARANTTTGYYKITNGSNSVIAQESSYYPTYYFNTSTYYGITTRPRLTSVDTSAVVIIESCTSSGTASGNIQGIDIGSLSANKVKQVDISGCGVLTHFNAGATGGSPARTKPAGGPGGSRSMASLIEEVRAVGVGASLGAGGYHTHHSGTVNVYGGGIDLWNQQLDAAALNQLYTDLATTSVSGTRGVFVGANPGIGSDNPSIASGYTIYGS